MAELNESLIQEAIDKDKDLNILINNLPSKIEVVKKSKQIVVLKSLLLRLINLADLFELHRKDLVDKIAKIDDIGLRAYFTQSLNQIVKNRQRYEILFAKYSK